MKKVLFVLCALALVLTSCSQDAFLDIPEELSYEDFMIKKSKEFARKYNIDLEINREALRSLDHVYSVEEMEEVYKSLSGYTIQDQSEVKWISEDKSKLRIKRRISLGEGAVTPPGYSSASFKYRIRRINNDEIEYYSFLDIESTVSWGQPMPGHGSYFNEAGSSKCGTKRTYRSQRPIDGNFTGSKEGHSFFWIDVPLPAPFRPHAFAVNFSFENNSAHWSITPSTLNDSIWEEHMGTLTTSVVYPD